MGADAQIINVLNNVCEKFGVAIDWTQSNITPYLEELSKRIVNYELVTSIFWIVAIFALLFLSLLYPWIYKLRGYTFDTDDIEYLFIKGSTIILATIFILVFLSQTFDIITCFTLPEKVVFDFIINSVRNTCYVPN